MITIQQLLDAGPCSDGKAFLQKHKTLKAAWLACENSEWMIWALSTAGLLDDRLARAFSIKCAEHVLHFFEEKYPDNKRPRLAIQAAKDFLDGKISEKQLDAAWAAARDAEIKWQADKLRKLVNPFSAS